MDLIVDLPNVLQRSILCEWLNDSLDVCRLDSAYCNRKMRAGLLQTLASSYIIPTASTHEEDLIIWLLARNIKAVDLTMRSDLIEDEYFIRRFCGEIGSNATSISFEKVEEDEYVDPYDLVPFTIPRFVWPIILENCSKLRELNCIKGRVDSSLCAVIAAATQLRVINFEGARNLTVEILQACCAVPNLEELNIQRAGFVATAPATGPTTWPADGAVLRPSPTMRTLRTRGSNLPSEGIYTLLRACTNLTQLSMRARSDLDIVSVAKLTPHLRNCTISHLPTAIDPATASELCTLWPIMERLHLFLSIHMPSGSDDTLLVFIRECPTLYSIHLMDSSVESDKKQYKATPSAVPADYKGSRLVELQTAWMSTDTLQTIIDLCPYVSALHLFYPMQTGDRAPLTLLHNTRVKSLLLEGAILIDHTLESIRNMEHVYFLGTMGILTSDGWTTMARQCPHLKTVVLSGDPHIVTRTTMITLLDASPKLETLVMRANNSYRSDDPTHYALNALIKHCYKNLRSVEMEL